MMNVVVKVNERRIVGQRIVTAERRDLHFIVHKAISLSHAKRRARQEFEERNPMMVWMGASFVSQQELKATVVATPAATLSGPPVVAPAGTQTASGRRR
jgi:hypothetical protein